MYLIAGLGNPTFKYRHTRHNVGFDALDFFAKKNGITIKKKKFQALIGEGNINGKKVILLKPQTYMNRSGESISMALKAYGLQSERDLIVLVDDTALSSGMIRIRTKGSSGGHNGLKNIIGCTGSELFTRIRIGVGEKPAEADLVKYVLSRPNRNDMKLLKDAYEDTSRALELLLFGNEDEAMNKFNGKQKRRN